MEKLFVDNAAVYIARHAQKLYTQVGKDLADLAGQPSISINR